MFSRTYEKLCGFTRRKLKEFWDGNSVFVSSVLLLLVFLLLFITSCCLWRRRLEDRSNETGVEAREDMEEEAAVKNTPQEPTFETPPLSEADPIIIEVEELKANAEESDRELEEIYEELRRISCETEIFMNSLDLSPGSETREHLRRASEILRRHGYEILALREEHLEAVERCVENASKAPDKYRAAAELLEGQAESVHFSDVKKSYHNVADCWRAHEALAREKLARLPLSSRQVTLTMSYISEVCLFLESYEHSLEAFPVSDDLEMVNQLIAEIQSFAVSFQSFDLELRNYNYRIRTELDAMKIDPDMLSGSISEAHDEVESLVVEAVIGICAIFMISDEEVKVGDVIQLSRNESGVVGQFEVMTVTGNVVTIQSLSEQSPMKGDRVLVKSETEE